MMSDDSDSNNINDYVPSILNPRVLRRQYSLSLTQNSIVSRSSLSLKKTNRLSTVKHFSNVVSKRETDQEASTPHKQNLIKETQKLCEKNSTQDFLKKVEKENCYTQNLIQEPQIVIKDIESNTNDKRICKSTQNLNKEPEKIIKDTTKFILDNKRKNLTQEPQIVIKDIKSKTDDKRICLSTQNLTQEPEKIIKDTTKPILDNKRNCLNTQNLTQEPPTNTKYVTEATFDNISLGLTLILNDLDENKDNSQNVEENFAPSLITDYTFGFFSPEDVVAKVNVGDRKIHQKVNNSADKLVDAKSNQSYISLSSVTEDNIGLRSVSTVSFTVVGDETYQCDNPTIKVEFGVNDCETVDVKAKSATIKRFSISRNNTSTVFDCDMIENSQISTETEVDENMNETSLSPRKRPAVAVNLEIKKQKMTQDDNAENTKVLILKTNAIKKISHVIVQPPNYKFVKRNLSHKSKYKNDKSCVYNGDSIRLKQLVIDSFYRHSLDVKIDNSKQLSAVTNDVSKEMSRNSGNADTAKCERWKSARLKKDLPIQVPKSSSRDVNEFSKSARMPSKREISSTQRQDIKGSNSDAPSPKSRNESMSAHSPKKNVDSFHFNLPAKSKSNKTPLSPRNIPHHKIVAGTHFAVDAFSYGDIPNVKHYFLTHFHSDHYCGLKKTFSKLLFCSKITADLCISRLGVNQKNIRVINIDEVLRIEGVEVAAVDANHCPGALMLVFTLPNGKTLLHTGDFRACPAMESYPVFWNKDIHTVYLDTTYCNPRYDFPTQDQSLEMALYILRQKKMALEKAGKKFSSVLIVCGTYTIGKEKFFIGMSRRVGCAVWACPEKERVLQTVEGRECSREPPDSCQLHVVPMRDLTHEKLRSYLDSLHGAFTEVVAFKPSGWENGKNSSVEKDMVTIHGIPYSEHSSFSELIRFVKFLKPKQVVPTVDISGGMKSVQKYFPCPLVYKEELHCQTKVTDYFSIQNRQQVPAVT